MYEELTPREKEALQLLCEGLTAKEIAERMYCALPTVQRHLCQVRDKLKLRSAHAVVAWAFRHGVVK